MSNPKNVVTDIDRHGNKRWYFRTRYMKTRLPEGPEAPRFAEAYEEAVARNAALRGEHAIKPKFTRPADRAGYVYFLRCGRRVKIGFSGDPLARLLSLQTGLPGIIDAFVFVPAFASDERRLHRKFAFHRKAREWFAFTPDLRQVMARAAAFGTLPEQSESHPESHPQEHQYAPAT